MMEMEQEILHFIVCVIFYKVRLEMSIADQFSG